MAENRGDKLLIEPDVCISELISTDHLERILIMYPYEFRNEQILKNNIPKMTKVIREYINESELYRRCIDAIPNLIWDSQKHHFETKLMNIKEKQMN